jgi:hypothetical protein
LIWCLATSVVEERREGTTRLPHPDLARALRRLKAVLRTMPTLEDEDRGMKELAAEIAEWLPLRKAATSEMLDTE